MPPIRHTRQEEYDFLQGLLSELDTTVTPVTPRKAKTSLDAQSSAKKSRSTPTRTSQTKQAQEDSYFDDLEDDWDWDNMNPEFLTPRKAKTPQKLKTPQKPHYESQTCTRCVVKSVEEQPGRLYRKILMVEVTPDHERRQVIVQDDWAFSEIHVGDTVNVIGSFHIPNSLSDTTALPTISITSKTNLFIHHPDILITATALSNAPQCGRRPLISGLVRSTSDVTPALVWGNMLHEVMQACLSTGRWDEPFLEEKIREVVQKGLGELMRLNVSIEHAIAELSARSKGLKVFGERYVAQSPKPEGVLTNTRAAADQTSLLAIKQLLDIEEDIWSPTYGLKGKLDASVEAVITDVSAKDKNPFTKAARRQDTVTETFTLPFEIKTGRAIAGMEHRAQTLLYTLLLAERVGAPVPSGLLYYTQGEEVVRVPQAWNEIRALIVARNSMAGYLIRRMGSPDAQEQQTGCSKTEADLEAPFLPETIDDNRTCGRCYALDACMLYRKAVENIRDVNSPIADIYELKTGHLSAAQCEFFKKWEALIALEEQDLVRFKKELWTLNAKEREEKGRCFADMVLDPTYDASSLDTYSTPQALGLSQQQKIHRATYRFVKKSTGRAATTQGSLLSGHMSCGDAVTVSVEPHLLALARGFIVHLTPREVILGLDHALKPDVITARLKARNDSQGDIVFRIDKDELFGGMGRIRDNLAQLFYAGGNARLLRLVVDLQAPRFTPNPTGGSRDTAVYSVPEFSLLNDNQRAAMDKVLSAEDYALILGMPGTGKTTVIAAIIRQLVSMGKTVLLASYTHSAVDTILFKLKDDADFGILRLGNLDKIHPDVHKFTLAAKRTPRSVEELEQQVMSPPVVATTCLSIDHSPCGSTARKGGFDVSLFRRLSDAHPKAVIDLTDQYRMNEDIMLLSNKLIYSDRLRCGSDVVAKQSLALPDHTFLRKLHLSPTCQDICWLSRILDPSCKAVFVDTDLVPACDSHVGDLVENQVEAQLVRQVTETLLRSGVREAQIGVVSLYRQQIKLLSYLLQEHTGVEILTADRSQGRDKDCIIISMVRSNDGGQIGDLVKDWRRMNVCFTRARSKLIIFGSRKTLQAAPLLSEFFELMDQQQWVLHLPPGAHEMHDIPGCKHTTPTTNPKKRPAEVNENHSLFSAILKTKDYIMDESKPLKKGRKIAPGEGLLKGRPILRDLVMAGK
ncbi:Dna2-domain-containing protein [Obba rivulosa]|uniref:DNA replication ATP-dependent helicase/nuclease DNA2 n=1 Tax=Obba rivulosa TaxID=1052685 RepID=A0A8E2ATW5_9APHY|nr:Dna2-domain-containing protein [Obba rivulosa]